MSLCSLNITKFSSRDITQFKLFKVMVLNINNEFVSILIILL